MTYKYEKLIKYLKNSNQNRIEFTFLDIEKIIESKLPKSAYDYPALWANDKTRPNAKAWLDAGWKTKNINLKKETVIFYNFSKNDFNKITHSEPKQLKHITKNERIEYFSKNITSLIQNFKYRNGPDLYFYKKLIEKEKTETINNLFNNNYYFELLYACLTAWDMNSRNAKMKYFDEFKSNIKGNKKYFEQLTDYNLIKINISNLKEVEDILSKLYDNLHVMKSASKLVSNSKIIHYILPNLVLPMDGKHTLRFFYGDSYIESSKIFLEIFEWSYTICKEIDLKQLEPLLNNEWNSTIPKIFDNAIICYMNKNYRINNYKHV